MKLKNAGSFNVVKLNYNVIAGMCMNIIYKIKATTKNLKRQVKINITLILFSKNILDVFLSNFCFSETTKRFFENIPTDFVT